MKLYDVFYTTDPGEVNSQGFVLVVIDETTEYWHLLVNDTELAGLPAGWLKFSELPASYKNQDLTTKHIYAGRPIINDGGFDEP